MNDWNELDWGYELDFITGWWKKWGSKASELFIIRKWFDKRFIWILCRKIIQMILCACLEFFVVDNLVVTRLRLHEFGIIIL